MDQHVEDLAFVVDGTPQVHPLAGHSPGMGRLWLELASRPRSLEPVERRVGSATLRAKPFRRVAWCLRRNRATPPGVGAVGKVPLEAGATTAAVGAIRSYSLRRSESWISFVPRSARDFCRHFFASSNRLAKMLFEPGRSGLREQLTGSRGGSVIIVGGSSSDRPQSENLLPSPASIAVDLAPDQ